MRPKLWLLPGNGIYFCSYILTDLLLERLVSLGAGVAFAGTFSLRRDNDAEITAADFIALLADEINLLRRKS